MPTFREQSSTGSSPRLSLRFLSGKAQGSEFVIDRDGVLAIGRSSEADLMLVEGRVSREHAQLVVRGGVATLEDLGSTNGTFVNGERIRKRDLRPGDRVLIGTTILQVMPTGADRGSSPPRVDSDDLEETTSDGSQMSGDLSEVSVPELLELLGTTKQKGVIELAGPGGGGFITINKGVVEDAGCDALGDDAPAQKCFERLLGWTRGSFLVRNYRQPGTIRLGARVAELLVDGLFHVNELGVLQQRLPALDQKLGVAKPLSPPLSDLDELELEVLQLAHNLGRIDSILSASSETDHTTARVLLALMDRGYLVRA